LFLLLLLLLFECWVSNAEDWEIYWSYIPRIKAIDHLYTANFVIDVKNHLTLCCNSASQLPSLDLTCLFLLLSWRLVCNLQELLVNTSYTSHSRFMQRDNFAY
jgi:hypothetical protein